MLKYIMSVTNLVDNTANNLEGQVAQEYQSKGANIINSVLSGNIFNKIDIYANQKEKEEKGTNTQMSQHTITGLDAPLETDNIL